MKSKEIKKTFSHISYKIGMMIFSICFLVFTFLKNFNENMTPKLLYLAELNINKYIEHTASDFKRFLLEKDFADHFLTIKENQKGEITSINYDMKKIYEVADELTNSIEKNILSSNQLNEFLDSKNPFSSLEEGLLLLFRLGQLSDSVLLSNLGPKIPVLIQFVSSVFTNVKSRVTDYGINNVLLEVYLEVTMTYDIITPIKKEQKKFSYDLLLDSKVLQGTVPSIYGGVMEKSTFFEVSFP